MDNQSIKEKIMAGAPFKIENSDKLFQVFSNAEKEPLAIFDSHNTLMGDISEVTEESFIISQKWMGRDMVKKLHYNQLKF